MTNERKIRVENPSGHSPRGFSTRIFLEFGVNILCSAEQSSAYCHYSSWNNGNLVFVSIPNRHHNTGILLENMITLAIPQQCHIIRSILFSVHRIMCPYAWSLLYIILWSLQGHPFELKTHELHLMLSSRSWPDDKKSRRGERDWPCPAFLWRKTGKKTAVRSWQILSTVVVESHGF